MVPHTIINTIVVTKDSQTTILRSNKDVSSLPPVLENLGSSRVSVVLFITASSQLYGISIIDHDGQAPLS